MSIKTPTIFATLSVCTLLAFSSCNGMFGGGKTDSTSGTTTTPNADLKPITVNEYTIGIPSHMYSSHDLNDDASLQYNDTAVEEYIIIIDEPKADFIKDFSDNDVYDDKETPERNYRMVQMKSMSEKMMTKDGPSMKALKINGMDAEIVDFTAKVDGIESDIFYKLAFVEGTKNMYMIMTWTLGEYKSKHNAEMNDMLTSFKVK